MKVTVIGVGNIGGAIARGLAKGTILKASDITCTDLVQENLDKMTQSNKDFVISTNNIEAVKEANIIIIAVKPWRVESVINEIKYSLKYDKQIIVSIAAGIPFDRLNEFLDKESNLEYGTPSVFRVIPNTAIEVCSSMTFVSSCNASDEQEDLIVNLFNELGSAMLIEEQLMTAGTALASSGIAFAMRYIRASTEGGVELGFYPNQAKEIVLKTVKGAVDLLIANQSNPETEIDKVTTPGGITIKGLNEMELSGFTSSVIRGLKASK
ncbi:MAG: pyrroline-5-carboxylate reductase [Porphyromonadaceae bacterium]|nr:pyrroline-5-carboxylate reductase [uncultured Macellibacteroides sp.]MCE5227259.1 pyrroline-5-carboxylate reductase [Porphyromonadaceae bacterium]